jgi:hypothetical protein
VTDEPASAGLSRRRLLGSAIAAVPVAALPFLLTACKGVQALGTPGPPAPDIRLLQATITAEQLMVARYSAAIAQLPAGDPTASAALAAVQAVRAEHSEHLSQLRTRLIEPPGLHLPRTSRSLPAAAVPAGSPAAILAALASAERSASDRLIGQLAGLPPALAQLFASIAASEATHAPFLQSAVATT